MDKVMEEHVGYYATPAAIEHHFDLDRDLEEPYLYRDFHAILRQAGPDDMIYLHINCDGGIFETAVQIINSINMTRATVIGCAEGSVASGAAAIFFSCHGFQIAENAGFLIHNGSGGFLGKPNDTLAHIEHHSERIKDMWKSSCGQFFTKKELKQVYNGKELYLTGDQVADRISSAMEKVQEGADEESNS